MTQRKKSQSIGLLMIVVFSAMLLWALAAVVWPVPVVYADDPPEILTITVTSSLETYFYNPGLDPTGGTVYFNSVGGEGAGQVLTVTMTITGSTPITLTGAPAFGDNPPPDNDEPWEITYTVEMSAGTQNGVVFTATNASGTNTAVITFTQDNVDPGLPSSPQARPDSYTDTGEYDDDTLIYFTWEAASDNSGGSGIATYYAEIGDSTPDEDAGADLEDTDTGTEGPNAYYVAAADHVGNVGSAVSDTITVDLTSPSITAITVTSGSPTYFYDPGLAVTGGEVFFNSLAGEGGGQTITVTISFTDANPYSLEGDTAFGDSPGPDTSGPPWTLSYSIETGAASETNRVFTVTDQAGYTDTAVITFTQDNVTPTVVITDVTDPGYDSAGNELDTDGSNWYSAGDFIGTNWTFTSTTSDGGAGLASGTAVWDHSNDITRILDCGSDGDGTFYNVSSDNDGTVTVTVTITDHVGNSASDLVVFNIDKTDPTITSPTIIEGSAYLYANGLTVYYGDDMGASPVTFRIQGDAQDSGVGLHYVTYSAALNQAYYEDFNNPENWYRDYTANQDNTTSGVITATIYDWVGNFATQIFTYTRDIVSPTISSPSINEASLYLHGDGTTLYYSDQMGSAPQSFTVQGNAADNGDGADLYRATFSAALGSSPGSDYTPADWSGTYDDVESSDNGPGTITVTVYDNVRNWSQQIFSYVEDTTAPTIALTDVTDPGYDENSSELDTDGSNWYNAGDFPGGNWTFTSDTSDDDAGLASGSAFWDHSNDNSDRTIDCGPGGDGTFAGVSADADGTVTVTVTITDNVGNSANDTVVFNIDNTEPTITSPYINDYNSEYLHVDGLTVYYGDDMGSAQTFTVNGHSSDDGGVGLNVTDTVDFSFALGDNPSNLGTPEDWWGEYTAASYNTDSGVITVTVYDLLDNPATQLFTYTRDTGDPTSAANSPQYDNGNPIVVTYTNATDTGGSGLQWVQLWYKKEVSGTWADSGLPAQTGLSGSFNFIPSEGDGTYYFATRAEDNVGNQEADPTGSGDDETIYDTTAPSVPGNFAYLNDSDSGGDGIDPLPGYYDDPVIDLEWDPSTDEGSGLLPTEPYHLGTTSPPPGGSYDEDSPYDVGSDGTYTIYLTAEDNAGNISDDTATGPVTVDTDLPQVDNINCPSGTAEHSFGVSWSATDQGPAGLRTDPYSVWYNVDGGGWQNWFVDTSATAATFGPDSPVTVEDGHTYCFRMRAVDKAGNVQYTSGNDCTEVDPAYSPLQEKVFLPIVVAPDPNWGFELGNFTSWQHGGELAQSVSTAMPHSGSYSARLGSPSYNCAGGVPIGSAWLRRSVTVPSSGSPTLSFWYRIYTQDKNIYINEASGYDQYDFFAVYINGSQLVVKDANTSDPYGCSALKDLGWKQVNFSLDAYKGQTIQITFYNYNRPDKWYNTYTYVDDVSVQ